MPPLCHQSSDLHTAEDYTLCLPHSSGFGNTNAFASGLVMFMEQIKFTGDDSYPIFYTSLLWTNLDRFARWINFGG